MEKLLIVNADDFGLSKGKNYGIIEAHNQGIVSSTTAMVNMPGIEHGVYLWRLFPTLPVGLHFVLTSGKPLTPLHSLVDHQGMLGKWLWERADLGELNLLEIEQELQAQLARFITLFNRPPTHIDSHHHVHMIPGIFDVVERAAQQLAIPLRIDRKQAKKNQLTLSYNRSTDWFDSGFYGNHISTELFLQTLDNPESQHARSIEVMCHPAFLDRTLLNSQYALPRLDELDVLTSGGLKEKIQHRGYILGSFADL